MRSHAFMMCSYNFVCFRTIIQMENMFCLIFGAVTIQVIINHNALPCLLNLLTNNYKKSIKKEACWTISNITAGNKEQIQVTFY